MGEVAGTLWRRDALLGRESRAQLQALVRIVRVVVVVRRHVGRRPLAEALGERGARPDARRRPHAQEIVQVRPLVPAIDNLSFISQNPGVRCSTGGKLIRLLLLTVGA